MSELVGGFNPFENTSQIGNLPQIGVKIKIFETTTQWTHPPLWHSKSQMHKRRKSTVFTASSSPSRSRLPRWNDGGRWPLGGFGRDVWCIDIYKYIDLEPKWPLFWLEFKPLEPKWPLFWLEFRPCFFRVDRLTLKNRGHFWVPGVKYKIKRCPTHQRQAIN